MLSFTHLLLLFLQLVWHWN